MLNVIPWLVLDCWEYVASHGNMMFSMIRTYCFECVKILVRDMGKGILFLSYRFIGTFGNFYRILNHIPWWVLDFWKFVF